MASVAEIHSIDGRSLVPENIEAEAALLGALLIDNSLIPKVRVSSEDFYLPVHGRLFAAIKRQSDCGKAVNALLLRPEFEDDEELKPLGGVVYLARLSADQQGLLAPHELAEQIHELAQRRGLLARVAEAGTALRDGSASLADIAGLLAVPEAAERRDRLEATAFVWRDEADIPARKWLYGKHLIRKFLSLDIAAGGIGKSSVKVVEALAMTTGKPLLGKDAPEGPLSVWLYNLEDPDEETERRIHAAAKHFKVKPEEIGDRLYVNSGRDQPVTIAEETEAGTRILRPVADAIIAQIQRRKIDVLILDPFVSSHQVSENDNRAIDMVAKEWARIADVCDCSINLVHHVRKQNGAEVNAESSRGAVSLIGAARSVIVYNRMTREEAERANIPPDQTSFYFRMQSDKANLAPPEKADWCRMNNVDLSNGDQVGVACPWQWPDLFEGVTTYHLKQAQSAIADGEWREDIRSAAWAGNPIAVVLGLNIENPANRKKLASIIAEWVKNGALEIIEKPDSTRHIKRFVVVGVWADV